MENDAAMASESEIMAEIADASQSMYRELRLDTLTSIGAISNRRPGYDRGVRMVFEK